MAPFDWGKLPQDNENEVWVDIYEADSEQLRAFLQPLNLHSLLLERCLDQGISPGIQVYDHSVQVEYPSFSASQADEPAYLTILFQFPVLITIRHGLLLPLDDLIQEYIQDLAPEVHHVTQILYQIIDELTDLNVDAQIGIRDQLLRMSKILQDAPSNFDPKALTQLRWQVENMVSLVENQLYCVSSLAALDIKELQEPHRKAYIQDLVAEAEITQRGVYRLENQVNTLYRDYQMLGSARVEKRLRLLTIVSAITLPLGLVAGLLGMNVGGVPGIDNSSGFTIVLIVMVGIAVAMGVFFKRTGWFD